VQVDEGLQGELEDVEHSFHLLYFEDRLVAAVVLEDLFDLAVHFEQSAVA